MSGFHQYETINLISSSEDEEEVESNSSMKANCGSSDSEDFCSKHGFYHRINGTRFTDDEESYDSEFEPVTHTTAPSCTQQDLVQEEMRRSPDHRRDNTQENPAQEEIRRSSDHNNPTTSREDSPLEISSERDDSYTQEISVQEEIRTSSDQTRDNTTAQEEIRRSSDHNNHEWDSDSSVEISETDDTNGLQHNTEIYSEIHDSCSNQLMSIKNLNYLAIRTKFKSSLKETSSKLRECAVTKNSGVQQDVPRTDCPLEIYSQTKDSSTVHMFVIKDFDYLLIRTQFTSSSEEGSSEPGVSTDAEKLMEMELFSLRDKKYKVGTKRPLETSAPSSRKRRCVMGSKVAVVLKDVQEEIQRSSDHNNPAPPTTSREDYDSPLEISSERDDSYTTQEISVQEEIRTSSDQTRDNTQNEPAQEISVQEEIRTSSDQTRDNTQNEPAQEITVQEEIRTSLNGSLDDTQLATQMDLEINQFEEESEEREILDIHHTEEEATSQNANRELIDQERNLNEEKDTKSSETYRGVFKYLPIPTDETTDPNKEWLKIVVYGDPAKIRQFFNDMTEGIKLLKGPDSVQIEQWDIEIEEDRRELSNLMNL